MKTLNEQNQTSSRKHTQAKNTEKANLIKPLIIKDEMLILSSKDGLFLWLREQSLDSQKSDFESSASAISPLRQSE